MSEAVDKALEQLNLYGLQVDALDTSGKLQRVPVEGDKGRKKSGWYVAHEFVLRNGKTVITGRYGNWKFGNEVMAFEADYALSDEDLAALREKQQADRARIDAERRRAQQDAARRAEEIWSNVRDTGNSEYLKRKQVRGLFVGYQRDAVLVPLRTVSGRLVGIQYIYPDGSKKFLTGTAKKGAFHLIGDPALAGRVLVAEGYATAASLFEATQIPVAVAFDAGNLLPVAQALRSRWPDLRIGIAADDDHATDGNPGISKATAAANAVSGWLLRPAFIDAAGKTDFNDMAIEQGLQAVRECVRAVFDDDAKQLCPPPEASLGEDDDAMWQRSIARNKDGDIKPTLANTYLFLSNLPQWRNVIAFDEFASRIVCVEAPPFGGQGERLWTDNDDTRTAAWLAMHCGFQPRMADVQKVVEIVAEDNQFHRVREYLRGLKWDKTPRLRRWLIDYLGALPALSEDASAAQCEKHEQMEQYLIAVGTKWMVGAVARVMRPGCKMDNVLILEGRQGEGKSTALKILAGADWFNETMVDLGDKDARQLLRGKWIIELAELDSLNKADTTRAKGFFSTCVDTYRESYGRRANDVPRQCVFAGTTNQHEYLRDDVNRRYWPVDCQRINLRKLQRDRDQLWAEAFALFNQGVKWWPLPDDKHLFEIEQQKRHVDDPWFEQIAEWLDDVERQDPPGGQPYELVINEVMTGCLKLDMGRVGERVERIRIGRILNRLGWVKRQRRTGQHRYYYVRGRE